MNALLDANVVLDVLLTRQPWFADAARVWDAHSNGQVTAAIAAFAVPCVGRCHAADWGLVGPARQAGPTRCDPPLNQDRFV